MKPDPSKVGDVYKMEEPGDKKAVERFLGFVNYLAKFLPHLSEAAEPLRRLTDVKAVWHWDEPQKEAFHKIKNMVADTPVLRYFDENEEVTLQNGASENGLVAALLQKGQPVAFVSRALSKTAIDAKRLYLAQRGSTSTSMAGKSTSTDHKPLEPIFRKSLRAAPATADAPQVTTVPVGGHAHAS